MIINAEKFKPKNPNVSDKYSWNLYEAFKKYDGWDVTVYKFGWNRINGICDIDDGIILIQFGDRPWGITGDLNQIFSRGVKNIGHCVSWSGSPFREIEKADITDWFFRTYERSGRCPFVGIWGHDWIQINSNARKCKYCGKHEKRKIKTVRIIDRKEVWA